MTNRDNDGNFISIFGGLDKFINMMADMVDNDKDEMKVSGTFKPDLQKKIIGKYGINVKLGAGNTGSSERIKSLDDIFERNTNSTKVEEPATDVFEDEDKVTIVIELPGAEKEDIHLSLEGRVVTINAVGGSTRYAKKITLKFNPDYNSVTEHYNNSIYSVEIMKRTGSI
jgi:HSP20 family protein